MERKLIHLFYLLMRDELVPGLIERITMQVENTFKKCDEHVYSNKHLEEYAKELVQRLKD